MARFVTIEVGCDWPTCQTRAPEGDDTIVEKTVSIDNRQPRTFLLCAPKHLEAFEELVLPLMTAGVAVEKTRRSPRKLTATAGAGGSANGEGQAAKKHGGGGGGAGLQDFDCQAPLDNGQICHRTVHSRTGMAQHVIRAHGFKSLADYELVHPEHPDNHE